MNMKVTVSSSGSDFYCCSILRSEKNRVSHNSATRTTDPSGVKLQHMKLFLKYEIAKRITIHFVVQPTPNDSMHISLI
jgi:hypothetical protein